MNGFDFVEFRMAADGQCGILIGGVLEGNAKRGVGGLWDVFLSDSKWIGRSFPSFIYGCRRRTAAAM